MNNNSNLWEKTAVEVFEAPVLTSTISVDLVIIGGGYTGLSAALEAASRGASVAVLEAETIGYGGSGRNVGLVNAGLWLPPETVVKIMAKEPDGQAAGARLNRALGVAPDVVFDLIAAHNIECEAHRVGTLHCADSSKGFKQLQERYRQLDATGAPVTLLSKAITERRVGSQNVYGALHDARAGTLQPLSYARGLARAAKTAGARIFEGSAAVRIARSGPDWQVQTASGEVRAAKLLIATNAYHQPVAALDIPPVTTVHFFQLATEPLADDLANTILPRGEGCWDTGTIMTSFRKDAANRFIIGGMGAPDGLGVHHAWARRAMERLYPQLKNVELTQAWSGKISMPSDHIPKLLRLGQDGRPDGKPNGYAMFGYSGRGIGPGTVMGRAIANVILDEREDDLPIRPTNRFVEILPRTKTIFYETAARASHLVTLQL